MPTIALDGKPSEMKSGQRFNLNLKTLKADTLKRRNHKRPVKYVGRRKRTGIILTLANGRGQRRAWLFILNKLVPSTIAKIALSPYLFFVQARSRSKLRIPQRTNLSPSFDPSTLSSSTKWFDKWKEDRNMKATRLFRSSKSSNRNLKKQLERFFETVLHIVLFIVDNDHRRRVGWRRKIKGGKTKWETKQTSW